MHRLPKPISRQTLMIFCILKKPSYPCWPMKWERWLIKAKNSSKGQKKPRVNMMMREPSRKQAIIPMAKSNIELIINLANLHIANINKYLKNIKSDVIADFIHITKEEVVITMNKPVNASNLSIIEKYIKNISNINSDSINSSCLPKSKSYLKIVGLLHKMENSLITSDFIESAIKELHLFEDIILVSKPCIIKASSKSDMAVVWINIWDSQSGSATKNIINCRFNVGWYIATICGMNMNPGIPQYKNCWKWGHLTLSCCSHVSRCAKCYGAHITKHHRKKAWYCMENRKANHLATLEGELCPYIFKCMKCKGNHQVNSYNCPYWHNHFNRK